MAKAVLAYSGGVDTSAALVWLREAKGWDVVAVSCDLGQGQNLDLIRQRARKLGALEARVEDLREKFVYECIWPALRARARYGDYLLATALSRPIIVEALVRVAEELGATAIAHGGPRPKPRRRTCATGRSSSAGACGSDGSIRGSCGGTK